MANSDLPLEIILDIFSRLSSKCVGRCRTLSKSWQIHLSTTNFIKKHLITRQQTKTHQENVALITHWNKVNIVTSPTRDDEVFNYMRGACRFLCVLGSCNGLILVHGGEFLLLMNPITLKQVSIQPYVTIERQGYHAYAVYGFGYDSCADDYKLVQISSFWSNIHDDESAMTFVDVYYIKTGVWKMVDGYPYTGVFPSNYSGGAFVNGALHWIIGKEGFRSCIAAFDLANEIFSEIPLPEEFVRQLGNDVDDLTRRRRSIGLSVVGGFLKIVDNLGNGATDIWIMKEYGVSDSWVKFRIEASDGKWHVIVATLCYVEDGELVCLTSSKFMFACDLKKGTMRKVVLGEFDAGFAHGMAFVDSLISPEPSS